MAAMTRAFDSWHELLACPDCGGKIRKVGDNLECPHCPRTFLRDGDTVDLMSVHEHGYDRLAPTAPGALRSAFINRVYARHNRSRSILKALGSVLNELNESSWGINLGSGTSRLHPRLLNMDIYAAPGIDVKATALRLPFLAGSLRCVVCQEVLEHIPGPQAAVKEVARILQPGGLFYLQVPFIIGYHSGPCDYWRFTGEGLAEILRKADLEVLAVGPSVGAGTSMYRISVEFFASMASALWRRLYLPAKAFAALTFSPLRWADIIAPESGETNRIAGGFFAVARKSTSNDDSSGTSVA